MEVAGLDRCASLCKTKSSLFSYGTNDYGKTPCKRGVCPCTCEKSATPDGSCRQVSSSGNRLYAYTGKMI